MRKAAPGTVSIVAKSLPHYRIPFFDALRVRLAAENCRLRLLYGQPSGLEALRHDTGHVSWGEPIQNRILRLGGRELLWQGCLRSVWSSDLVVVEQASKLLLNYVLIAAQPGGGPRVALWGHGQNFQHTSASRVGEWIKRRVSRHPHWWFAYTEGSATMVRALGFPPERISVVQNAIDTVSLQEVRGGITAAELSALRSSLGIRGRHVAMFIGGLYPGKRLDYLIAAAKAARALVPDFELLILGAGSADAVVRRAAGEASWIHYVGPHFNQAKVPFFALASVLLLPAIAGLTVLDSFALEVPILSVAGEEHPPEFEYLQNGVNAIIVPAGSSADAYGRRIADVIGDEELLARLRLGCRSSARVYTLGTMVDRFSEGVLRALAARRGPR